MSPCVCSQLRSSETLSALEREARDHQQRTAVAHSKRTRGSYLRIQSFCPPKPTRYKGLLEVSDLPDRTKLFSKSVEQG